ncbi:hypothetical protein BJX65DRAFT_298404 [Aspergillus insuetus]
MSENGSSPPQRPAGKVNNGPYKRGYIACVRCRSRKVRCVIDSEPPCAKCRREHRQCVFKTERKSHRHREPPRWATQDHDQPSSCPAIPHDLASLSNRSRATGSSSTGMKSTSPGASLMERAMVNIAPQPVPSAPSLSDNGISQCEEAHKRNPPVNNGIDNEPFIASQATHGALVQVSSVKKETLDVWNSYSLVRQRWFTAQEAVTYLDLFFNHVSPLSPVLVSEYRDPSTHRRLISQEPILCCTMLMIASRYFMIPGSGGQVRSHFIHQRLWQRCIRLLEQISFGKDADLSTADSVLGIIESCLLISDWHPRSAHFPADHDELDGDPYPKIETNTTSTSEDSNNHLLHWFKDVIEPLAYKVGLFSQDPVNPFPTARDQARCIRTGKLLYVYVTNLSIRLGCPSPMPQSNPLIASISAASNPLQEQWERFIKSWLDLVRLIKTASAMFFESTEQTRRHLLNGHYVIFLQHFTPSLIRWRNDMEACSHECSTDSELELPPSLRDLLLIEYNNLRVYTHALAMQAIVERALSQGIHELEQSQVEVKATCFTNADYEFLNVVIAGSSEIMELTTNMAESGNLPYIPVRQSLCIISAAIFLIKAMSIGSWRVDIRRESPIDEMDFSSRFANLMEKRIAAFRASVLPPLEDARCGALGSARNDVAPHPAQEISSHPAQTEIDHFSVFAAESLFDPTVAPFGASGTYISSLERDSLDFLWNLPQV